MMVQIDMRSEVRAAIASVDDPEYPGLSIVDLGLLESFEVEPEGVVQVGLIPTFSGCPALAMIAQDVVDAVEEVEGVSSASVSWLRSPTWSAERLTQHAQETLADEFTVAVQIGQKAPVCPLCGSATTELSMFGPSRCRSVSRCKNCSETVEVLRA